MMQVSQGTIGSPWHQAYHSSSSTSDLSGYNHEFLRRSPDQYSSRGSMESLDQASAAYHHHLPPAKSTNCIDQLVHLHNKRDSAYSSFSTNASIPEYRSSPFSKERSYSMESMHSRNSSGQEGIKHADIKYIKTVYDVQRGISEEYEVNSSSVKNRNYSRQPAYNRHSIGPHGRLEQSRFFSESGGFERAAPMPPTRSDSYAVTRHHERPNSWSSLDQNRNFRTPKAAGLHSTNTSSNAAQQPKHVHGDGHLHPVLERSPESSPLIKPKQVYSETPQPGQPMLPTGIYPVPAPEPHFAHAPQPPKNNNGRLYPALAKEGSYGAKSSEKVLPFSEPNKNEKDTQNLRSKSVGQYPMNHSVKEREKKQEGPTGFAHYKLHFTAGPDISTSSLTNDRNDQQPLRLDNIDINEQQKNGTKVAEEFSVYAHPAFQNEWSDSKTKQDIASSDIIGLHRNSLSSDAHGEHEYHNHFNIASSSHNKMDERSNRQADHRKKLESLSFTVHADEADGPSSNPLKPDESPSPSQKKSYDFTRRRLSSSSSQSSKTDGNKLSSVFDKVCKIEQREHENHRSQFLCGNINQSGLSTRGQNNKGSFTMVEEIRNKFISQDQTPNPNEWRRLSSSHSNEKVTGMHQLTRQGIVYGLQTGDAQKQMPEKQAEKMHSYNQEQNILQAVPDDDNRSFNSQTMPNKEDDWQCAAQDTLGFNRAYRNSVKDAQCKVLEATSYRRKDLEISPPHYKKPEKNVRPASAPFRKKSSSLSPHAPKERHSVTPTDNCASIQESQGVFFPSRIGAKRRITAEQKKRSYSEPEKMNEVGASESESAPLTVSKMEPVASFSENSVADRRRIFEREGKACSTINLSKPQLKQLQQNALADYIERKTGRRPSSQETRLLKERSQSTYFSGSIMDNQSMTSTSSMNSLNEHNLSYRHREPLSKTGRVSSTLPPGLTGFFDLSSFENNPEYPENRSRSSSFAHQLRSERLLDHRSKVEFGKGRETNKPKEVSLQSDDDVIITSSRRHGKSASAEDLLDRLPQPPALHVRSRSSPASDMKSREYMSRQEVGNKTSYASASNKEIRSIKSNHFEQMSFTPSFKNHIDTGEDPVPENSSTIQRSAQLENQRNTKTQSISGIYSPHPETKQEPLALPIHSVPAKVTQTSLAHATFDYITAEEYLYSGKRGKESASPTDNKEISDQEWCLPENSSSEDLNDPERFAKYTSAQRPQSFETKSGNSINETVQQNKSSGPTAGPKFSTSWKSNGMWSSGSSEAETTFNHGKISLHISESCLQPQSPMTGQEDEGDDEVFVKEQDTESFSGTFVPPSPPPFPPPSLEDALLKQRIEKFPLVPNTLDEIWENTEEASTQVKVKSNERYLQCASEYTASTESSGSYLLNSGITKRDTDGPLLRLSSIVPAPEPLASPVDPTKPIEEQETQPHGADTSILQSSEGNFNPSDSQSTLPHVRSELMSSEDAKSQELAKEIVTKDKSLANILDPDSRMKTTMDLMEGLFTKSSSALKEKNQKRKAKKQIDNIIAPESEKKEEKRETLDNASNYSAYYSTSAPKAELLRKMKTIHSQIGGKEEQFDVNEKKAELISSLTCKLEVLKDAKESLIDDIKLNNSLGEEVETQIETLCKPNEFDKYKMFIGDLDKVVNLLLSLSGRLARVENALSSLGEDASAEERKTWNEKKKQLCGQHEDARELKENLDRREKLVMDFLGNYLTGEEFAHYQHFVKMKSALLIEQRELDDKIKLGQEQLRCLTESLPSDYLISMKVSLPEERRSSLGNKSLPPSLTSSL
ncbi:protein Shroom3 isoform X1 [Xenopus laevis]|uniref:protein Shroom3 isoform X1 n=2 Tax=Xenopus laevis TaxID=8355 RepID=A0A1L8HVG4_XENLA|nr:protein Shroom3 isoform X1 [Xenopus laevis]XP_018104922.1 protein Shroom3 isoform X1 [Xenopus laevis]XP_018104929.1 protein Shroom3 isoform X1 [Xenopus laevis]XP_041438497.1 protein Shroom3 isoform X1 [Xenopus laevis]OCU00074.1 hypothetical protein XELAEV_18005858mg [Xenopus laevis]